MNCPKCGFENLNDAQSCQKCANVFASSGESGQADTLSGSHEQEAEQVLQESSSQQGIDASVESLSGLGSLLKSTFSLIKKGFWRYVLINFLGVVIIPLILLLILYVFVKFLNTPWLLVVLPFLFYYFYFWKYSVIVNFIERLNNDENKLPLKKGFSFALGLWVFGIVFGFLLNIGFFLLIIPGIYWGIKYFLTPYTYCLEEKRIFRAFGLTSDYTKGFVFAILARIWFFIAIFIVGIIALGVVMMFALPLAGVSIFGLMTQLTSEGTNLFITFLPFLLLFVFIYFVIFTLIEIFGFVYFYNIFDSLRKIKKRAWAENRQVTDGYSFGKKILVLIPIIIIGILIAVTVFQGFKQAKDIGTDLLGNQQKNEFGFDDFENKKIAGNARSSSRDAKRISDIKQVQTALELYYSDTDNFIYPLVEAPGILGQGEFQVLCDKGFQSSYVDCDKNLIYMRMIPNNPEPNGSDYTYQSFDNGKDYIIEFTIESDFNSYKAGKLFFTPDNGLYQNFQEFDNYDFEGEDLENVNNNGYSEGELAGCLVEKMEYEREQAIQEIKILTEEERMAFWDLCSNFEKIDQVMEEWNLDSDKDGLSNYQEGILGTDINNTDTDRDDLSDYDEVKIWQTDPSLPDTDGDGYLDGDEVENGYDPLISGSAKLEDI